MTERCSTWNNTLIPKDFSGSCGKYSQDLKHLLNKKRLSIHTEKSIPPPPKFWSTDWKKDSKTTHSLLTWNTGPFSAHVFRKFISFFFSEKLEIFILEALCLSYSSTAPRCGSGVSWCNFPTSQTWPWAVNPPQVTPLLPTLPPHGCRESQET